MSPISGWQGLALAVGFPVLALLIWGEYLARHRAVSAVIWRIAALPVALVGLAPTLAALQSHIAARALGWAPGRVPDWIADRIPDWAIGGAVGEILHQWLIGAMAVLPVPLWSGELALAVVVILLAGFALPLGWAHWRTGVAFAVRTGVAGMIAAVRVAARLIARTAVKIARVIVSASQRDDSNDRDRFADGPDIERVSSELDDDFGDYNDDGHIPPVAVKRVAAKTPTPKVGRREKEGRQKKLELPAPAGMRGSYQLPPLDLLAAPVRSFGAEQEFDKEALEQNARMLESVLDDFGVKGDIVKVRPGPVVTMYELEPAPGTKTSRVISLADDIARSMSAVSVRIAVVPGKNAIGIELPNAMREMVYLRELLAAADFERSKGLALALGKDIAGAPVFVDLARMPHLLIAGTTGSGKSVGVNSMVVSLLYRFTPEECRFIMIDPKMLELSAYDGIPHLLAPVVTDPKKAVVALKWVVREMETRYQAMSKLGVRSIDGYNQRLAEAREAGEILRRKVQTGFDSETGKPAYEEQPLDMMALPRIVVVVDEMADLMLVAGKDVEAAIQRLAQMARAAGIHLIMATQRPSVDVVTGTIKANFPTRISFQVTSKIDSRTILGESGAEQLLGQGDMLYMAGGGRVTRVHGPFVTDTEIIELADYLREQGVPEYEEAVTADDDVAVGIPGFDPVDGSSIGGGSGNELYDQAVALVAREGKASTSFIQRHLQIGYNRAARIMEQMEKDGVVSLANHVGKREVLVSDQSEPAY